MPDIEDRLDRIERSINDLHLKVGELVGAQKTTNMIIKYIVFPLIIILGALVGVKIMMP